jgi:hypothetical protein
MLRTKVLVRNFAVHRIHKMQLEPELARRLSAHSIDHLNRRHFLSGQHGIVARCNQPFVLLANLTDVEYNIIAGGSFLSVQVSFELLGVARNQLGV